jgi:hypothetical protein
MVLKKSIVLNVIYGEERASFIQADQTKMVCQTGAGSVHINPPKNLIAEYVLIIGCKEGETQRFDILGKR